MDEITSSTSKLKHFSIKMSEQNIPNAARAAVGDVLERRNTFFTRAAASVVKMPATKKPVPLGTVTEQRSRNNSASSTASSKSDKSNGNTRQPAHVNVNVKHHTVEMVETVEF